MPKVTQCTLLRSRRASGVSLGPVTTTPIRAVSFEECRSRSSSIDDSNDLCKADRLNTEAIIWASDFRILGERKNLSFAESRSSGSSSLLRSRSRGVSMNLSLLASMGETSSRGGPVQVSCPPTPTNGAWGQFIDFVPEEDYLELSPYNHGTLFSKSRSLTSVNASLAHPYLSEFNSRRIRGRSNNTSKAFGLEAKLRMMNQDNGQHQSSFLSPSWMLSKESEPSLFSLGGSLVSTGSVLEESHLEEQLQELHV
mmetsp:Transcript_26995/g.38703  ORF Transcript_26995/g.38703 Transcript_26995/m.38703 type:complete len:254 (-) Transcript_26995:128-889(-)